MKTVDQDLTVADNRNSEFPQSLLFEYFHGKEDEIGRGVAHYINERITETLNAAVCRALGDTNLVSEASRRIEATTKMLVADTEESLTRITNDISRHMDRMIADIVRKQLTEKTEQVKSKVNTAIEAALRGSLTLNALKNAATLLAEEIAK